MIILNIFDCTISTINRRTSGNRNAHLILLIHMTCVTQSKTFFLQGIGVLFVNIHRAFCNGARDPGASYINNIFPPITESSLPLVALFSSAFVKETYHIRDGAVLQFCNAKNK